MATASIFVSSVQKEVDLDEVDREKGLAKGSNGSKGRSLAA